MGTDKKYQTFLQSLILSHRKNIDIMSKDKKDKTTSAVLAKDSKEAKENKSNLGALEEDDDFEEFPTEDWGEEQENKDDMHVWEDEWDDDDVEDDFSQQLRSELAKHGHSKK